MAEHAGKPKVRFAGFTETWEQRKLGEIAEKTFGGGTPSTSNPDFWSGKIPWIQSSDLTEDNLFDVKPRKFISKLAIKSSASKIIPKNSIAIIVRVGVGKLAFLPFNYSTSQDFLSITEINVDELFASYSIYKKLKKDLSLVQGTSIKGITKEELLGKTLFIPIKKSEQARIGAFFRHLDRLVTLHQRKRGRLENIKKAMLEKMFPKNGADVPEVRFAGFTEAWEQRKLVSLCEKFTDGDWIEAKDQSNSGVRLIQTGNVGLGEYIDKQNNKKWISKETFERLNCEEVFSGDILISRLPEPAGRACIVPNLGTKMITAVDCTIVRTATQVNPKYLLQYLSSQSYFDEVNTCLAGGTRQRISRSNLATFDVSMPVKYEEQKAIGEFLCGMDHLITLHQRKVALLQNIKKACLEKMFV